MNDEPPPEGPEVRKITDQLAETLSGANLVALHHVGGRYASSSPQGFDALNSLLTARDGLYPVKIESVDCKGKFIFMVLSNGWSIWNTLGMTGAWSHSRNQHTAVTLTYLRDGECRNLFFNDIRRFGTIKAALQSQLDKKLKTLGVDVLAESIDNRFLTNALKRAGDKNITCFLMDQRTLSGIGNYIKAEVLFRAGVSPWRTCQSLTTDEIGALNDAIYSVTRESYQSGGTTIQTYRDVDGVQGKYSSRLKVYNRKKDPSGNDVIREETPDGRTTHWVPSVQC